MSPNICVSVKDISIFETFKRLVIKKYGKLHGFIGEELNLAMQSWIDSHTTTGEKNNFEDENLRLRVSYVTAPSSSQSLSKQQSPSKQSKRDGLKQQLDENNVSAGSSIERGKLIKIITGAGYGHHYAAKEIAPKIIQQYNLDIQEDGLVRVWLSSLGRYEWMPKNDVDRFHTPII